MVNLSKKQRWLWVHALIEVIWIMPPEDGPYEWLWNVATKGRFIVMLKAGLGAQRERKAT